MLSVCLSVNRAPFSLNIRFHHAYLWPKLTRSMHQNGVQVCLVRKHNARLMSVKMEDLTSRHRQCVKPDQVRILYNNPVINKPLLVFHFF